ncbi:MAG: archaellin/type IV pilin N-terminal domain-containing protein [Chloroflexota bacterium]|nr:archaellin/type IV pilin N-terminal domain-containing protein [Chloroflexota bacterium]
MLKKLTRPMHKDERGITGLETAIILIAFVVVAAVFAYTVLSAGLFSTQKGQEAVYSGLEEAQSTLQLKGGVIAKATTTGETGTIGQITFTVTNALGGEAIDFTEPTADTTDNDGKAHTNSNNVVVISYIDDHQRVEDLYWSITKLGEADADNLLEIDEKFQITIGASTTAGASGGNLVNALEPDLSINDTFTIEVKTPKGAVLPIERTTPSYIDTVMSLN